MNKEATVLRSIKGDFQDIPKTTYEYNLEYYKGTSKSKVIAELTYEQKYISDLLTEGQQLKDENAELKGVINYLKNEVRLQTKEAHDMNKRLENLEYDVEEINKR